MRTHFETALTGLLNANGVRPLVLRSRVSGVSKHLAAVFLLAATSAHAQTTTADPHGVAILNALDKITARVSQIEAPLDEPVRFGSLEITVRACFATPPEEAPESKAFLEVRDIRPGGEPQAVFSGWMFASSPALSAMEHSVYDVWVIACKAPLPESSGGSAP